MVAAPWGMFSCVGSFVVHLDAFVIDASNLISTNVGWMKSYALCDINPVMISYLGGFGMQVCQSIHQNSFSKDGYKLSCNIQDHLRNQCWCEDHQIIFPPLMGYIFKLDCQQATEVITRDAFRKKVSTPEYALIYLQRQNLFLPLQDRENFGLVSLSSTPTVGINFVFTSIKI